MTPVAGPQALLRIRIAMISGIVAFAVIVFVLKRGGMLAATLSGDALARIRVFSWIAAVGAAAALIFLRTQLFDVMPDRRATVTILGWATGQFAALAGLAFYMLSGVSSAAAPGLLAFAFALVAFPARPRD